MSPIATTRYVYPNTRSACEGDALEVQALYHGQLIGTRHLQDAQSRYVIGATADADAPVAQDIIGASSLPLVTPWGQDYLVNVTPRMGGELWVDGRAWPLQDYVRERGRSFALPPQGQARVDCGEVVFVLGRTSKPQKLPRPWLNWRWAEQKYTAISAFVLGLFLIAAMTLPPDTRSLSFEDYGWTSLKLPAVSIPPVEKEVPEWLTKQPTGNNEGQAAAGPSGEMGDPKAQKTNGRAAFRGPKDNPRPALSKEEAAKQAANAGFLGILNQKDVAARSIFGSSMSMGQDPESVLGGLVGVVTAAAGYGQGGLGATGSGAGGGGTGERSIGFGNRDRIGTLGRGVDGSGNYGTAVGWLRPKRTIAPEVTASPPTVRGSLDKEIIRRIVRLHMNEVKYCYEKELTTHAGLAGRISVQFAIGLDGQVFSSVLQSSSMGNLHVESCVVNAVRRWGFPKPSGGGVAIVVYPFNFTSPNS